MAEEKNKGSASAGPRPATQPGGTKQEKADTTEPREVSGAELDRDRPRRTGGVTAAAAEELSQLGVNPALDNRTGDQRPEMVEWPAKPQQVDGPEVGHFAEHAEQFGDAASKSTPAAPAGTKAEGPHGLGPHGSTVEDAHGEPLPAQAGAGDAADPRNPAK